MKFKVVSLLGTALLLCSCLTLCTECLQDHRSARQFSRRVPNTQKSCYSCVTVYYSRRISQLRKSHVQGTPGGHQAEASSDPLSLESPAAALHSPSNDVWPHIWSVAKQGCSPKSRGPEFALGGSITQAWVTHMTGVRKQTQAFTVNCIISIDYLVWPKAPVIQRPY